MMKAKPRNLIPIILALLLSFGTYLLHTAPSVSAQKPEGNHYETGFPMSIALILCPLCFTMFFHLGLACCDIETATPTAQPSVGLAATVHCT